MSGGGWWFIGGCLVAGCVALRLLAPSFAWEANSAWPMMAAVVAVLMVLGAIYMALPALIRRSSATSRLIVLVVGFGVVMRVLFFGSDPILEDDHYRYLWDGAVTAEGHDPFRYTPQQAAANGGLPIHDLAVRSGEVVERVNHPHYRTVYPTLAQAGFALAYAIAPFSLDAWRGVLLAAELVGLGLILLTLKQLGLSPLWAALYWWNPLIVKELANSAHMDGLLIPLLAAIMLTVAWQRHVIAALLVMLGAGIKLWPLLLLPAVLPPLLARPRVLMLTLALVAAVAVLLALPVLGAGLPPSSGFIAYGTAWQMNDAGFSVMLGLAELIWTPDAAATAARLAVIMVLALLLIIVLRKPAADSERAIGTLLIVSAGLFLLGPTGFPWYIAWFLPFLTVVPVMPLLLLTALLPLYYLRFAFAAEGMEHLFDRYIVWLEFGPVWLWLGLIAMRRWRQG